jgi:hypothetical protein
MLILPIIYLNLHSSALFTILLHFFNVPFTSVLLPVLLSTCFSSVYFLFSVTLLAFRSYLHFLLRFTAVPLHSLYVYAFIVVLYISPSVLTRHKVIKIEENALHKKYSTFCCNSSFPPVSLGIYSRFLHFSSLLLLTLYMPFIIVHYPSPVIT